MLSANSFGMQERRAGSTSSGNSCKWSAAGGGQKAHFRAARGMGLYARGVRDKAIIFQYKFTPLRGFVFALLDMYIWGKKAVGTLKWSNWRIYIYIFFIGFTEVR